MGIKGYLYYIRGFVRYVNSSVELHHVKCSVVHLRLLILVELPPSTVRRGRPIPEGRTLILWSNNSLVSLLCQWIFYLSLTFNFNLVHILEEHGCPTWSLALWSIRVDPCPKSIYLYIYLINFFYIILTTITISILNSHQFENNVNTYFPALVAGLCEDDVASKSTCCCSLSSHPNYLSRFSSYYISIYNLCSEFFTQPFPNIVKYATIYNNWWSIRVDPFYN